MKKDKFLWGALVLTIIFGMLWQFYPLPDAEARLKLLPLSGENFQGWDAPLDNFERTAFRKVNLLKRVYQVADQKCFITALDGTHDRHIVHDPFYCFVGSGWRLINKRPIPIKGGNALLLNMKKGFQKREALVWFSDGRRKHCSALYYFFQSTLRRLTLGFSGREPILIVIQPYASSSVDWAELLREFPELQRL